MALTFTLGTGKVVHLVDDYGTAQEISAADMVKTPADPNFAETMLYEMARITGAIKAVGDQTVEMMAGAAVDGREIVLSVRAAFTDAEWDQLKDWFGRLYDVDPKPDQWLPNTEYSPGDHRWHEGLIWRFVPKADSERRPDGTLPPAYFAPPGDSDNWTEEPAIEGGTVTLWTGRRVTMEPAMTPALALKSAELAETGSNPLLADEKLLTIATVAAMTISVDGKPTADVMGVGTARQKLLRFREAFTKPEWGHLNVGYWALYPIDPKLDREPQIQRS